MAKYIYKRLSSLMIPTWFAYACSAGAGDPALGDPADATSAGPEEIESVEEALTTQLHARDQRDFGWDTFNKDYYYTVGSRCTAAFERAAPPNPVVNKMSGNGFCEFLGWVSPSDPFDCSARIHAHTSAFSGVQCETMVYEQRSTNACCDAHSTKGCASAAVAQCVCSIDSYCCANQWDQTCVEEVTTFGCGRCVR